MNSFIRIPLFFAAFVILGLGFGYLTFKILSFSRTVEVPQLSNMTLIEANESLTRAGLYLKIEGEDYDSIVLTGRILRQDIPADNKVKEKRTIKVVVSKGPRVYSVPLIIDKTLAEAETVLVPKGLRVGKIIHVHSDTVAKGKIVAQRPEPDDRLSDLITALVSLGPHELSYYCPDFQSSTLSDARELAERMGLSVETAGPGDIIKSQRPRPGTIVKNGETIYLEMKEENRND